MAETDASPTPYTVENPSSYLDPRQIADILPFQVDEDKPPDTYLDPEETAPVFLQPAPMLADPTSPVPVDVSFRHSGWRNQRYSVYSAMYAAGCPQRRLDAFIGCGGNAWVVRDAANHEHLAIASQRCHDRFCIPCAKERARIIAHNLREKLPDVQLRFLTLTLKSVDEPLRAQLVRLRSCFNKFRSHPKIKDRMTGGVSFLELTISAKTGLWHPHLHIIFQGSYLPQNLASLVWHDITKDSYIVHVRSVTNSDAVRGYLASYLSAGLPANIWRDKQKTAELIRALAGTRTIAAFGSWSRLSLARTPLSSIVWEPVCTLSSLIAASRKGCQESIRMLRILNNGQEPTECDSS